MPTSSRRTGWERYDTTEAVEAMNDLYRHELRLEMNVFLPSVKLLRKVRVGAQQGSLDPFELHRRIEEKLGAIYEAGAREDEPLSGFASRSAPTSLRPLNDTAMPVSSGNIFRWLDGSGRSSILKWLDTLFFSFSFLWCCLA